MTAATTTPRSKASAGVPLLERPAPRTLRQRTLAIASSAAAAVLGVLPHVLHHAGALAGAALLAGTRGSLFFGAIGLLAAVPLLLRVHHRCGSWRIPTALLALFAVVFSISTFVIGPVITGDGSGSSPTTNQTAPAAPAKEGHDAHH